MGGAREGTDDERAGGDEVVASAGAGAGADQEEERGAGTGAREGRRVGPRAREREKAKATAASRAEPGRAEEVVVPRVGAPVAGWRGTETDPSVTAAVVVVDGDGGAIAFDDLCVVKVIK